MELQDLFLHTGVHKIFGLHLNEGSVSGVSHVFGPIESDHCVSFQAHAEHTLLADLHGLIIMLYASRRLIAFGEVLQDIHPSLVDFYQALERYLLKTNHNDGYVGLGILSRDLLDREQIDRILEVAADAGSAILEPWDQRTPLTGITVTRTQQFHVERIVVVEAAADNSLDQ